MAEEKNKAALTPAWKRVVELMQEVKHGRIEGLTVRGGEPVSDPPPTAVRLFVFGKTNGPHPCRGKDGFSLKRSVTDLIRICEREQSLTIRELLIDDGLPVRMSVTQAVQV